MISRPRLPAQSSRQPSGCTIRSYPETLRHWRRNFQRNAGRAERLGYDRRFRRLWELYLAWCEGGFRERRIGDVQVLLAKPAYRGSSLRSRPELAYG